MDPTLSRGCPVCSSANFAPYLAKGALRLVRCTACTMVYANHVPSGMASGAFYDEAGQEYLAADKLGSDYSPVRFQRELRLFRRFCPRGAVLDVGCSSGGFLHQLQTRYPGDYQVLGTDVSKEPLEHAAKMGVPVARGDFREIDFPGKFDAITFWAVMEHLFEPQKFLARAASMLKPGGLCFVLTPNMDSLAVRMLGWKYRYIFPEHLNYFTPKTLRRFFEYQLEVVQIKSTHFNPLVIWQDFWRSGREVPRAERAALLKRTNAYKQSTWMLPVRAAYRVTEAMLSTFGLADNIVVIAKKQA